MARHPMTITNEFANEQIERCQRQLDDAWMRLMALIPENRREEANPLYRYVENAWVELECADLVAAHLRLFRLLPGYHDVITMALWPDCAQPMGLMTNLGTGQAAELSGLTPVGDSTTV